MSTEGYKPSFKEEQMAEKAMDRNQEEGSLSREAHIEARRPSIDSRSIQEALDRYGSELNRIAGDTNLPTEWAQKAEKAKQIESDIRQKLDDLEELFKN